MTAAGLSGLAAHLGAALPRDLDPSTDQARQWLQDELSRSEYDDRRSLLQRFVDWLGDRLADLQGVQGTGGVSFPPVVIGVLAAAVVIAVLVLMTRIRVESRVRSERRTLLGDSTLGAEQLRALAEQALAEGRHSDAVVAWTRAIARDAEDRTLLPDARAMTAHEVGVALAAAFPAHVERIDRTMDLFDAVAYGGRTADRDDALGARETEATLRAARPALPSRVGPPTPPPAAGPPGSSTGADDGDDGARSVWLTGVRP